MKRMKKISLVVAVLVITSMVAAGTVWGYSALRKVDATANDNIKIYYNGELQNFTDTDGSKISPVIINGRTYLPLRAISDLVGVGIEWDGNTQSIYLTSEGNTPVNTPVSTTTSQPKPTPTANTETSKPSTNTTNKNKGTFEDPVKLGDTYYWSAREKYIDTYVSADYSFTVLDVEPVTLDYIESLGFSVNSDASKFDYVLVTAKVTVSNGKIESDEVYPHLAFYRDIWGSKTTTGASVIGGTDYSFDGSLSENARKAVEDSNGIVNKIKAGEKINFSYTGKVILPVLKGEESYLVVEKDDSLEYKDSLLYFRIK
ncbi:MAG TPA: stalk domain-containing protein [Acetivibrio sp.]|uniref:stalk domain-containing protein n=1 Tax=Acetivibrio sp. TaxID=1872092 RepID=UPI002BDC9824|nr:stalk domain-containing protein [Acetivibrio sp.]HOM02288.1 stalk domain-containing protein [Acetivibrio sp.]